MLRPWVALGSLALLAMIVGRTGAPRAQVNSAPPQPANICASQLGWCHLPTQSAPHGVACVCLTPNGQQVPGLTRFFPYTGPASPYLQPHTGPPTTIR